MAGFKTVNILGGPSIQFGRELVRGVCQYMRQFAHWEVYVHPFGLESGRKIAQMPSDGVLLMSPQTPHPSEMAEVHRMLLQMNLPVVNVSDSLMPPPVPNLRTDDFAIGEMGAEYLIVRGFRNLAFRDSSGSIGMGDLRKKGFTERAKREGLTCHAFSPSNPDHTPQQQEEADRQTHEWLLSIPRPVGVMAWNDEYGVRVIRVAERAGLRVPEEVAVLGVDNDEMLCELAKIPLSSVNPGADRIGFEAARLLDRMILGDRPPSDPILVHPINVVTRRSTDILAIGDTVVAQALRYIRDHACDPIFVGDVVKQLPLCRRAVERRFAETMGRTMHDEIHRVRTEAAKELLQTSCVLIPEVARRAGFKDPKRFSRVFRKHMGVSPTEYRAQVRSDASRGRPKVNGTQPTAPNPPTESPPPPPAVPTPPAGPTPPVAS
jgi:LacI family transcriptional regulator